MWPNPQETADIVTFTEEVLNGKLHFFVQCLLGCDCILVKKNNCKPWNFLKSSHTVEKYPAWWIKMDCIFKISTQTWFKKDITTKRTLNTLNFVVTVISQKNMK